VENICAKSNALLLGGDGVNADVDSEVEVDEGGDEEVEVVDACEVDDCEPFAVLLCVWNDCGWGKGLNALNKPLPWSCLIAVCICINELSV